MVELCNLKFRVSGLPLRQSDLRRFPFGYALVDIAFSKVVSAVMDRLINVLTVHAGDEALIERVYDEGAMPSRCGCDPSLHFPPLSLVFFRHGDRLVWTLSLQVPYQIACQNVSTKGSYVSSMN